MGAGRPTFWTKSGPPARSGATGRRWLRPTLPAFALGELLGFSVLAYAYFVVVAPRHFEDFVPYRAAGRAVWAHLPLYETALHYPFPDPVLRPGFLYPPPFALVPAALAWLPDGPAAALWVLFIQVALGTAVFFAYRAIGRPSLMEALLAAVLTLNFYPLLLDLWQGQVNTFLLLAAAIFLWATLAKRMGWMGVSAAFAAVVKITPGFWLITALRAQRLRALAWAALAGMLLLAAGVLTTGWDQTWIYFTQVLPALRPGTTAPSNQSIWGAGWRLFGPNPYAPPWLSWRVAMPWLAVLASLALVVWWLRARRGVTGPLAEATTFSALLCLLLLLASVSWEHHFTLLLIPLWVSLRLLHDRRLSRRHWVTFASFFICVAVVPRVRGAFPATLLLTPLAQNAVFIGTLILFFWLCSQLQRLAPTR